MEAPAGREGCNALQEEDLLLVTLGGNFLQGLSLSSHAYTMPGTAMRGWTVTGGEWCSRGASCNRGASSYV
jgi:hypothetical protein